MKNKIKENNWNKKEGDVYVGGKWTKSNSNKSKQESNQIKVNMEDRLRWIEEQ